MTLATAARCAAAVATVGLFYWGVVGTLLALQPALPVAARSWQVLFGLCLGASLLVAWQGWGRRPAVWVYVAVCCALLGLFFWGANQGLDALHGADRAKAPMPEALGGLELWCVLFPGATAVALAGAAARSVRAR